MAWLAIRTEIELEFQTLHLEQISSLEFALLQRYERKLSYDREYCSNRYMYDFEYRSKVKLRVKIWKKSNPGRRRASVKAWCKKYRLGMTKEQKAVYRQKAADRQRKRRRLFYEKGLNSRGAPA